MFRLPAKLPLGLARVAVHLGDVSGAARGDLVGNLLPRRLFKGVYHVEHAVAVAGAEIEHENTLPLRHIVHRRDMAAREIDDVQIVAHARAVRCGIVVAEYAQILAPSGGGLGDVRHQIVRDAARVLADESARMRADGVEVPQQHNGPFAVGLCRIGEDLLAHVLRPAVGIRAAAGAGALVHGHRIVRRIHRRGRGEEDLLHAVRRHRLAEVDGRAEVVVVVPQRLLHRLPYRLETGKVEHAVKPVRIEKLIESCAVQKIHFVVFERLSGDALDAPQALRVGVDEIVHHNDRMSGVQKLHAGVAADVSGAAGNENVHKYDLLIISHYLIVTETPCSFKSRGF